MRVHGLKICGISDPATALFCAEQGVGAVGVVFFPGSPRNVSAARAAEVLAPLPDDVARVGVFVDMPVDDLLRTAASAGLTAVQMHGGETGPDIARVLRAGYRVIKVLKVTGEQLVFQADNLPREVGVMIELSAGKLPGGNGEAWDWAAAAALAGRRDFALAGGLCAANLREAVAASGAAALDLSSAAESAPGVKDRRKIAHLTECARTLNLNTVFWR